MLRRAPALLNEPTTSLLTEAPSEGALNDGFPESLFHTLVWVSPRFVQDMQCARNGRDTMKKTHLADAHKMVQLKAT